MKLGIDQELKATYMFLGILTRSAKGWIQGGAKIGHGGPLLQKTSSEDRTATATNRMHSNDLEACWEKCCYIWFHYEVKFFWRIFDVFFYLVILPYFNAISIDCYVIKCLINIYFMNVSMFVSGRMLI